GHLAGGELDGQLPGRPEIDRRRLAYRQLAAAVEPDGPEPRRITARPDDRGTVRAEVGCFVAALLPHRPEDTRGVSSGDRQILRGRPVKDAPGGPADAPRMRS